MGSAPYVNSSGEGCWGAAETGLANPGLVPLGMLRAFGLAGRGNRAGPFKRIFRCLAVLPASAAHPAARQAAAAGTKLAERDAAGQPGPGGC